MNELIELLKENKISYNEILEKSVFKIFDKEKVDINFIIPIKNRRDFAEPMYESFLEAKKNTNIKISYTVIELSDKNEHQEFCEKNNINYIFLKTEESELFNKCLALNLGALFTVKANSFIFHDIDCLIQSDFFINLNENIKNKNAKSIQCFHGRRVLYLSKNLTNLIINKEYNVDDLKFGNPEITLPISVGAPGGSIYVEKDLFFKVGGFDSEFFQANAPEDSFFWDKIDSLGKMEISDNPNIDVFHMNHPVTYNSNPKLQEMLRIYQIFKNYKIEDKISLIKEKENLIKEYYYE